MGEPPSPGRTYTDFIKFPKFQGAVSVNGWPYILAVLAVLHHLQLPHAAHVCKPCLDLCHIQHLPTRTDVPIMINSEISFQNMFCIHSGEKASYPSSLFQKRTEACWSLHTSAPPSVSQAVWTANESPKSDTSLQHKVELSLPFQDVVNIRKRSVLCWEG